MTSFAKPGSKAALSGQVTTANKEAFDDALYGPNRKVTYPDQDKRVIDFGDFTDQVLVMSSAEINSIQNDLNTMLDNIKLQKAAEEAKNEEITKTTIASDKRTKNIINAIKAVRYK